MMNCTSLASAPTAAPSVKPWPPVMGTRVVVAAHVYDDVPVGMFVTVCDYQEGDERRIQVRLPEKGAGTAWFPWAWVELAP